MIINDLLFLCGQRDMEMIWTFCTYGKNTKALQAG